jgi:probable HAF family extracellular repeat protein
MVTGESTRHPSPHDALGIAFFEWRHRTVGLAPRLAGGGGSAGLGVNSSGVVVGWEGLRGGGAVSYPFMWSQEGFAHIGDGQGRANAINDAGTITGTIGEFALSGRAFAWRDGVLTDLGTVGDAAYSEGIAINAAGDIVGAVGSFAGEPHVMTYFDGVMADLGTFGGNDARATGINSKREICGTLHTPLSLSPLPFYLKDGVVTRIYGVPGMYSGDAAAINDAGEVVGTARIHGEPAQVQHAFLWHHGKAVDLNDQVAEGGEGWVLERATSINNRGEIVGHGTHLGESAAFKLTRLK